jgi:hypothetical protein
VPLDVVVHPLAERDLIDAWRWYEDQLPGLGDRLVVMAIYHQHRHPNFGTSRTP